MTQITDLKTTKATLHDLVDVAVDNWKAERKLNCDHIAAHIEQTREDLEWISKWEAQLVDYVHTTAAQMRDRIIERQKSLQGHLFDINDENEATVIEQDPPKRLNGSK